MSSSDVADCIPAAIFNDLVAEIRDYNPSELCSELGQSQGKHNPAKQSHRPELDVSQSEATGAEEIADAILFDLVGELKDPKSNDLLESEHTEVIANGFSSDLIAELHEPEPAPKSFRPKSDQNGERGNASSVNSVAGLDDHGLAGSHNLQAQSDRAEEIANVILKDLVVELQDSGYNLSNLLIIFN